MFLCHPLTEVLGSRGIDDIDAFLQVPSWNDLPDPFSLNLAPTARIQEREVEVSTHTKVVFVIELKSVVKLSVRHKNVDPPFARLGHPLNGKLLVHHLEERQQ